MRVGDNDKGIREKKLTAKLITYVNLHVALKMKQAHSTLTVEKHDCMQGFISRQMCEKEYMQS